MPKRCVILAACVAAVLLGGCTSLVIKTAPASPRPTPRNPDVGTILERFYEQIEDGHWPYAYAMLSPSYRRANDEASFKARYARLNGLNVNVYQRSERSAEVDLDGTQAANPARHLKERELVTIAWDGYDWKIVRIVPALCGQRC